MEDKLLTGDIWSEVNSLIKVFSSKKFAAISYVSTNILNMIEGDILICDASLKAISTGQTSARALLSYHNTGVSIFSCDDLHSKLLLSEDFIITGSSNLSTHSRETLIEMAIFSESKSMINEAYTFFEKLKVIAKELSEAELSELLNVQIDIASYQKSSMNRLLFSQNLFHFTTKKGDYTIIKQEVRKK